MAYYNPNQAQGYYDPYQNSQERTPGAISAIGNAAKMLLVMGGLNAIGNMAAGKISGMLGRSIKQGVLGKNTRAYAIAQNLRNPTIGGILKNTNSAKSARNWFNRTAVGKARASRAQYLKSIKGAPKAVQAKERVLSAFKSPATLAGAVGGVWARTALAGAPVAYMVDSALGVTQGLGLEHKKWYDVPGQIGNAAKWFRYESIYSTSFGAMGPMAGAAKGVASGGLRKMFGGSMGKYLYKTIQDVSRDPLTDLAQRHIRLRGENFFKKSLTNVPSNLRSNQEKTFAAKVIGTASQIGRTIREVGRYAGQEISPTYRKMAQGVKEYTTFKRQVGAAMKPVQDAIKNAHSIAAQAYKPRGFKTADMSSDGIKAVEFLTHLKDMSFFGTKASERVQGFRDFVQQVVPEIKKLNAKNTTDYIHGSLQAAKIRDIASEDWIGETFGALRKKFPKSAVNQLQDTVLNMRVGKNIYRGAGDKIVGGGVNLAAFDPVVGMKRALSFLTEHQIRVPLTDIKFSLGDITGWNDSLAKKENLHLMRHKPNFSLGLAYGDSKYGGAVSVGDLARESKGEDPLFINIGSKWGIFDGAGVQTVDTGRVLRYSRPNSKAKTREVEWIRRQNLIKKFGEAEAQRRLADNRRAVPPTNSKFLNWLDNRGMKLPGIAQMALRKFNDMMGGRVDAYSEAAAKVFGDTGALGAGKDVYKALPNIDNVLQMTNQVLSRVSKKKEFGVIMGEFCNSKFLKKNFSEVLWDDNSIAEKYRLLGLDIDDFTRRKSELHEAVEKIQAFPRQAEQHIVYKKLGVGSDMNSYDVARVNLIHDALGSHYWDELAGNGMEHPLIAAAGKMRAEGLITSKEMKAMQLNAKLSAFQSKDLFKNSGSIKHSAQQAQAVNFARRHAKERNWDMLEEVRNYISNNDIKAPRIVNTFRDTLEQHDIPVFGDMSPFASVPKGGLAGALEYGHGVADTLGNLLETVSPLKRNPVKHFGLGGTARYIAKNAAVIGLAWQGYRVADALVATNTALDYTSFDNGITGFVADNIAKTRLVGARLADTMGITGMAKHLEGLMPKVTSTLPGMIAGGVAGRAGGKGLKGTLAGMAWGAVINRIVNPYLPDVTKSYEELKEIYSGREQVPFMKSPTWLLGGTPWEGTKVQGFTPNWYVRAKSRWRETDTMYGSAFRKLIHEPIPLIGTNIGDVIDPYYMERLHYFDRPYPETGDFGSEIPIFGKLIAPTLGRIIKPKKTMHQAFLENDWEKQTTHNTYQFKNPPPTMQEHARMMDAGGSSVRSLGGRSAMEGNWVYGNGRNWADTYSRQFLMDATNAAGLQGFLARTALEKIAGAPKVIPTLETAGRMASMSRQYYDMNLGGMGVLTEPVRRLIEKPEYARYGLNPIPNMMPNWLPERFLKGDPYAKIMKGELRLPGAAYQATHTNIRMDMPGRASMVGGDLAHIVQYFTGLLPPVLKEEYDILETGTAIHEQIQDALAAQNLLVDAEKFVVDVENDITGHVDAIIRDGQGGRGRRAVEIKTISEHGFKKLDAPKYKHVGQLNFYLRQLGLKEGTFIYVMRDNPSQVKTFDIRYSQSRWEKDLNKLQQARQIAADMMQQGVNDKYGYSYSWLDRLNILADVAPSSKEYKEAKTVVERQIKAGMFTESDIKKYKNALKNRQTRIRKYELYPLRFKGKVMSPDTERNLQSINENIKAADQYSLPERVIGSMWERFTNTNFFVINKLWNVKDPLEHYKLSRLYGKEFKPWDEPYRAWIEPLSRGLASKTDPVTGGIGWATTGFVWGGGPGAIIGGGIGALYGTVHGLYRKATGTSYIPQIVENQRDIEQYFDSAKYERNQRLAMLSNGLTSQHYNTLSQATLTAFNQGEGGNIANLFRATPTTEKPYIEAWLKERDPKRREEILKYIPSNLANALRKQWGRADMAEGTMVQNRNNSAQLARGGPQYKFDDAIFDPNVELEDIKLKTLESAGYDAHEFGLGWNEQQLRMLGYNGNIRSAEMSRWDGPSPNDTNINQGQLRMNILNQIRQAGANGTAQIYLNNYNEGRNVVNIIIKRDRSQTIINGLVNRDRYM